jgi:hypothetical protein
MARLPPFDEPASPEVAAWRKARIRALYRRCDTQTRGAVMAPFVRANRKVLREVAVVPGARLVREVSIDQRDGNGCPDGTGPATYSTTVRTYRLAKGTRGAEVLAHYRRELYGWLESEITACEHTYGQGPASIVVRACNGVLRLSVRARAPGELPGTTSALPPRPLGLQYPRASDDPAMPDPTGYESEPGETCERISGITVPSIIVPPPPGIRAEVRGRQVVVEWTLGTVHGDCPPRELVFGHPGGTAVHELVHAASGVTRMRLLDGTPHPRQITARTVSVDGAQSPAVVVLVRETD